MAGGSDQERTEEATPKRREDARAEGRVPRSQELTAAVSLLGAALVLQATGPALADHLLSTMGRGLLVAGSTSLDQESAVALVRGVGWKSMTAVATTCGALAAVVLAVTAGQARGVLTTKPLTPSWEKVNPAANLKRMLGLQPIAELVKSLLKLVIVGLAVWQSLGAAWPDVVALAQQSPVALLHIAERYALRLLLTAGGAYLALAVLDYLYQIWQHEKSLRMSKEDVKQEAKQNEGDPMIKARRRSFGRAMARKQMLQDVPKADVVVVNPVHIAVALKYDPERAPAPLVLAVGQRKVAERIKQLAFDARVPVVENKPLARALIAAKVKPGTMIPAELYVAVAEVLAFVIRQRAAQSAWRGTALA